MANITYRGNTITPGINASTVAQDAPLTNVQLDKNFASIDADLGSKAPLVSPSFTGTPEVPTAPSGTSTTQAASTAFATQAAADAALSMAIALG